MYAWCMHITVQGAPYLSGVYWEQGYYPHWAKCRRSSSLRTDVAHADIFWIYLEFDHHVA
jgi:hypothetical protein